MKKKFLSLAMLVSVFFMNAQNPSVENTNLLEKKHELRLGAIKLLSGSIFEASYEYILDSNQGLGAYLLVNFNPTNDWLENYSLTPYYRMYFQTNEDYGAKGFFVEGFSSFFLSNFNLYDYYYQIDNNKNVFDISIGLSLGKKWINTAGFVFETRIGAGRNLLGNAYSDAILKIDLSIGYRF